MDIVTVLWHGDYDATIVLPEGQRLFIRPGDRFEIAREQAEERPDMEIVVEPIIADAPEIPAQSEEY